MSKLLNLAALAALALSAAAISATPAAAKGKSKGAGSSSNVGKYCTVLSGSNKGKKGVYGRDGSCSGAHWSTECRKNGKDNGKCKIHKKARAGFGYRYKVQSIDKDQRINSKNRRY